MKWELIEPKPSDMIRVKNGAIYHFGIYISDNEIIQFGPPPNLFESTLVNDITVISTNIDYFLQGGFLEVSVCDKNEATHRFKSQQIIKNARQRLGEGGYNILNNNCEHFVYECVFGEHKCTQTDDIRALFKKLSS